MSTKLIQVRLTIFAAFCIQHEIFLHRWLPVLHPWPPQNVMATAVTTGGAAMGSAVTTGGLRWIVSTGASEFTSDSRYCTCSQNDCMLITVESVSIKVHYSLRTE